MTGPVPPTQLLTQVEYARSDFAIAERIARELGYQQTAYTSTSSLWGLFCLKENPATWNGPRQALTAGCIIKTKELGLLFVQSLEDLNLDRKGRRYGRTGHTFTQSSPSDDLPTVPQHKQRRRRS